MPVLYYVPLDRSIRRRLVGAAISGAVLGVLVSGLLMLVCP